MRKQSRSTKTRDGESIPKPFSATRAMERVGRPEREFRALTWEGTLAAATGVAFGEQLLASQVQSLPAKEWAHLAALWGEYRVISLTMHAVPRFTVISLSDVASATTAGYPGPLVSCAFGAGTAASAFADCVGSKSMRPHAAGKVVTVRAAGRDINPFALEWAPTNGAIQTNQQFGVVVAGDIAAPAGINAVEFYHIIKIWDVEFRTRQA